VASPVREAQADFFDRHCLVWSPVALSSMSNQNTPQIADLQKIFGAVCLKKPSLFFVARVKKRKVKKKRSECSRSNKA